jgi:hypothetical protein
MFFEFPAQESHFKFSVANDMDGSLWKDPTNTGLRPYQATGAKTWNAMMMILGNRVVTYSSEILMWRDIHKTIL